MAPYVCPNHRDNDIHSSQLSWHPGNTLKLHLKVWLHTYTHITVLQSRSNQNGLSFKVHITYVGLMPSYICLGDSKPQERLLQSYYNLDLSVRPSVRLFHISSAVYGPIASKLGRIVGDGTLQELRAFVSTATKRFPWKFENADFEAQVGHEGSRFHNQTFKKFESNGLTIFLAILEL